MMFLTKNMPARKKTVHFRWCKKDFLVMDDGFRAIRAKMRNPMDKCFWCGHSFVNGEMMALAAREKAGNVVLCQECASKLMEESA